MIKRDLDSTHKCNSFEQFLNALAQLIINRIKKVVGDARKAPLENEDANLEDDEFVSS